MLIVILNFVSTECLTTLAFIFKNKNTRVIQKDLKQHKLQQYYNAFVKIKQANRHCAKKTKVVLYKLAKNFPQRL